MRDFFSLFICLSPFAFFAVLGVFAMRIPSAKTPRTAKNAKNN